MGQSSHDELDLVITTMAKVIVDNADYFAQLDSIAGDGDFGYSLRNGWEVILADYDGWDLPTTGAVLKKVGATLAGKVGGVSGPMWGTAFLRAGATAGDKEVIAPEDVIEMLRAAIAGIMLRGGAQLGDKTLLDALAPVTDSLEASIADPAMHGDHGAAAIQRAADVAVRAAEDTMGMLALRGRAAYTGERSRDSWMPVPPRSGSFSRPSPPPGARPMGTHRRPVREEVRQRPEAVRPGDPRGDPARERRLPQVRAQVQPHLPGGHAQGRQGLDHPGLGIGHEPAHTMIVGPGMLDAACPGDVFAGPPVEFVYRDLKLMDTPDRRALHRQQLHGRPHARGTWRSELCRGRGHQRIGYLLRQRRRRGQGLDLDGRPPRRRGQLLRDQGRGAAAEKGRASRSASGRRRRSSPTCARWVSRSPLARRPPSGTPMFEIGDDEMEVGDRHPRRAGPACATKIDQRQRDRRPAARRDRRPTCRSSPATRLR